MQPLSSIIIIFSLFYTIIPNFSLHVTHDHAEYDDDQQALLAIKSKISPDPIMLLSSWNKSVPLCQWWGVTCGRRHKRVVGLDLSSNGLVGTLSPFVGNLSFLHTLMLQNNTFYGDIPPEIGHLSRLRVLRLANNSFEGEIPSNLSRCVHLIKLQLSYNNLTGKIPMELSTLKNLKWLMLSENNLSGRLKDSRFPNMTSLEILTLGANQLEGSIPDDIGKLKGLLSVELQFNKLSGTLPPSLYNLSLLRGLNLDSNGIHGQLPQDLGFLLPNLQILYLTYNFLSGYVPKTLSNLTQLEELEISFNNFTGKFLFSGKNMQNLTLLSLVSAYSKGDQTNDLSFIETLTNCSRLTTLQFGGNDFGGVLPSAIVNLSSNLEIIQLQVNRIYGSLPSGWGKFVNLYALILSNNQLTGPIPADMGELQNLVVAYLSNNNFLGSIPTSFGHLSRLSDLRMHDNRLVGHIPSTLGNCKYLLKLDLSENNIRGMLPSELFYASQLVELSIARNKLQGPLPAQIGNLKNLVSLKVWDNKFSDEIPSTLSSCTALQSLYMGGNSFSGSIPLSFSSLKSLQTFNVSHNNLSGQIPSYLSAFPLISLDLSFNNFEGEVPNEGVFSNTTIVSLVGNKLLCGGVPELHFPKCPSPRESKTRKVSIKMLKIILITVSTVLTATIVLVLLFYYLNSRKKKQDASSESLDIRAFFEVSYRMLWEATEGFSPSNLIDSGGFGFVYKGILHHGDEEMTVAIKVMKLHNERANKSFIAECKALRNIRHRNLVKIITACSSVDYQGNDFKALVYEFMPNGSLESWLHPITVADEEGNSSPLHCLNLLQRVSIALDVACAVEYLHGECPTPIIHCDLKPSNILLDDELIAHVSDFGLAKFLLGSSDTSIETSSTQVRGTVGYTAPEYGLGSKVSAEGDIYSFGIIVLEMMTSKKPTDPAFNEGLNLHNYVKSSLPNQVMEIVDPKLIDDGSMWVAKNNGDIRKIECIKLIFDIGIQCSLELPHERMQIKDIVNQLRSAKQNLLSRKT